MSLSPIDLLHMTWRSTKGNLVRSGLTTLGIFMGVLAVSAILNVQTITSNQIALKLAEREKPFVNPHIWPDSGESVSLTQEDEQFLKQTLPAIQSISKVSSVDGLSPIQFQNQEATKAEVKAISLNYRTTTGRRLLNGRFFDQIDLDQYRPVALVDQKLASILFKQGDPRNQAIFAAGHRLLVIGVLENRASRYEDPESQGTLWINENFARVLQSEDQFKTVQISARLEDIPALKTKLEKLLKQRFPDAEVWIGGNAGDLIKEQETLALSSRALMVVGVLALMIAGVGIANITIASVMERIAEIGLRRAIGATQSEIMLQFILEAVLLSLMGGAGAIATVHGLTQAATTVVIQVPYQFSVPNALVAMGSAVVVGVGSSFLPALRATKVDIVKALRGE